MQNYLPLRKPIVNPGVIGRIAGNILSGGAGQLQAGSMQGAIAKTAGIDPNAFQKLLADGGLAQIVQSTTTGSPSPLGNGGAAQNVQRAFNMMFADIEASMLLNPQGVLSRHFKVYWLGGVVAGTSLTFKPQKDVIPLRMVTRYADAAAGLISNLEIGITPIMTNGNAMSARFFGPQRTDTSQLPPVLCQVGQQIGATVSGVTRVGMLVADVDEDSPMASPLTSFMMPTGFTTGAIGANSPSTVAIAPQVDTRLRRLGLSFDGDPGDVFCTAVAVGNRPQLESTDPIPVECFEDSMQSGFVDGDPLKTGQSIFLSLFNNTAAPVTFQGCVYGDTK